MKTKKLCCFTVNTTHALIIANNYIQNNLSNVKVIYINDNIKQGVVENIISRFYPKLEDKIFYTNWLNEQIINNCSYEKLVFVVNGSQAFIEKVNAFLTISNYMSIIINCYDVSLITESAENIVKKHDSYVNTTGIANYTKFI